MNASTVSRWGRLFAIGVGRIGRGRQVPNLRSQQVGGHRHWEQDGRSYQAPP
jgi:hypothetical protein